MDAWIQKANADIKALRPHVNDCNELISSMVTKGYIISYPEVFKRVYWNENE